MYEMIKEFIRPELVSVVIACYIIGVELKKTTLLPDKYIPLVLGAVSVALCVAYVFATSAPPSDWQGVSVGIITGFVQGILCAGASVYVNQLGKQLGKGE